MNCFFIASWVDILHCELDACTRRLNAPKQKRLRNTRRCGHRGAEKVEISGVNWIVLRPRLAALRQFRSQPPASRYDTYEEPVRPSQKTAECRSRAASCLRGEKRLAPQNPCRDRHPSQEWRWVDSERL